MKLIVAWCAAVMLLFINLHAEPTDIDREIAKIKAAPPEERVKLMNEFKRKLFKMNQEERSEAIQRLKHSMRIKGSHGSDQKGGSSAHQSSHGNGHHGAQASGHNQPQGAHGGGNRGNSAHSNGHGHGHGGKH
ncbi:hypothetical protein [Hydrogenimonas sp.]|uniref:hypothetical protein n=1 Tax=Hydrogenimonas sp. TaxID=2231112 RepID=UPI0026148AE0|nr:hypothetical protein [Hydrogenimonas sp.]